MNTTSSLAQIAISQKELLLDKKRTPGYAPHAHDLYRDVLPKWVEKCKADPARKRQAASFARDAVLVLGYLHAMTHGTSANAEYMWAFPDRLQIVRDTGINNNRLGEIITFIKREGYLITKKIPRGGDTKLLFLPLYFESDVAKRLAGEGENGDLG